MRRRSQAAIFETQAWRERQAEADRNAAAAEAKAQKFEHRSLESCRIIAFAHGVETWRADHGVVDEKGRKVGGVVWISSREGSSQLVVRIQATRDGVAFGALRRDTHCTNLEHAHEVATRKLTAQRKAFRAKFPAVAS